MDGLSCDCDIDWYPDAGETTCMGPQDYTTFPTIRRKRCCSCKTLISPGSTCIEFERLKTPDSDVELAIWGDDGEIPRASWWMCEECADLYWSLTELGFCFDIKQSMRALAKEYANDFLGV